MQLQEAIKEGFYNFFHLEYAKEISILFTIFAIFILLLRDGFKFVISTLKNWKKAPLIGCFFLWFLTHWHKFIHFSVSKCDAWLCVFGIVWHMTQLALYVVVIAQVFFYLYALLFVLNLRTIQVLYCLFKT